MIIISGILIVINVVVFLLNLIYFISYNKEYYTILHTYLIMDGIIILFVNFPL